MCSHACTLPVPPVLIPGRVKCSTCFSQLSAYNLKSKQVGEKEVNENDPSIYAMENKLAWRIDGAKWKEVVALASCLFVIKEIVFQKISAYTQHHPDSKKCMQSAKIFNE